MLRDCLVTSLTLVLNNMKHFKLEFERGRACDSWAVYLTVLKIRFFLWYDPCNFEGNTVRVQLSRGFELMGTLRLRPIMDFGWGLGVISIK